MPAWHFEICDSKSLEASSSLQLRLGGLAVVDGGHGLQHAVLVEGGPHVAVPQLEGLAGLEDVHLLERRHLKSDF